jgi:hypothetical protein
MKMLTPTRIAKAIALTSFSVLSTLAIAPAQAVILNFESLAQNNSTLNEAGTSYTENGFTLSQPGTQQYPFYTLGSTSTQYPRSTALINGNISGVTRLTQVGGGSFTLSSISLTAYRITGSPFEPILLPVTFKGTKTDATIVSRTVIVDGIPQSLNTFLFSDFTNLTSVEWTQTQQPSVLAEFDNINVTASAAVPEPFTILGTIFGAGYGVALKRKLTKAQADKQDIS